MNSKYKEIQYACQPPDMTQNVPDGSTTGPHFQTFLLWKGTQVTLPHLPHRSPDALKHTATPLTLLIKKHSTLLGYWYFLGIFAACLLIMHYQKAFGPIQKYPQRTYHARLEIFLT